VVKTSLALKIAGTILATCAVAGGGIALAAQSGSPIRDGTPSATATGHNGQGDHCEGNDQDATTSPNSTESARPSSTNRNRDEDAAEPTATSPEEPKATEAGDDEGMEQSEGCSESGEDAHGATSTPHNGAEDPTAHPSATNTLHSPDPARTGGHD
jgi:hypothetical protein